VLGFISFAIIASQKTISKSSLLLKLFRAVSFVRAIEVLAMLVLPAIATGTHSMNFRKQFAVSDASALLLMIGGTAWIYYNLCSYVTVHRDVTERVPAPTTA
jgi:ABC-type Mn2+/Zn2+ transport system permease subunit